MEPKFNFFDSPRFLKESEEVEKAFVKYECTSATIAEYPYFPENTEENLESFITSFIIIIISCLNSMNLPPLQNDRDICKCVLYYLHYNLIYVSDNKQWRIYNKFWKIATIDQVRHMVGNAVKEISDFFNKPLIKICACLDLISSKLQLPENSQLKEKYSEQLKFCMSKVNDIRGKLRILTQYGNSDKLKRLCENLQSSDILVMSDQLDRTLSDEDYLVANNGVINLKAGELIAFSDNKDFAKKNLITIHIDCDYDPEANSQIWNKFISDICCANQDMISYLQLLLGYAISKAHEIRKLWVFKGEANNGKTTLLETVKEVLGKGIVASVTPSILTEDVKKSECEIIKLKHKRIVYTSEINYNQYINEASVKTIIGGDTLTGKKLYCDIEDFTPTHKLFCLTNYMPKFVGSHDSISTKFQVIPFNARFEGTNCDENIKNKLVKDKQAVLTWLVKGSVMYYHNKDFYLDPPTSVKETTDKNILSNNPVAHFISDVVCDSSKDDFVETLEIYNRYSSWCKDHQIADILSKSAFGKLVKTNFDQKGYTYGKKNDKRGYRGCRLKILDEFD